MLANYVEMTVLVPVSQFVKVEAEAAGSSRSTEDTASFLLSKWVLATHGRAEARRSDTGGKCKREARRSDMGGKKVGVRT
ncbi:MAG: hypothetical protein IKO55_16925 [Kiritimatiellae bacterium]|nr:hypothetical protein [Kiritimatiellia bacterium]